MIFWSYFYFLILIYRADPTWLQFMSWYFDRIFISPYWSTVLIPCDCSVRRNILFVLLFPHSDLPCWCHATAVYVVIFWSSSFFPIVIYRADPMLLHFMSWYFGLALQTRVCFSVGRNATLNRIRMCASSFAMGEKCVANTRN